MPGVLRTRVGYCGGKQKDPTYRKIGDHTEALQIDFDPAVVTYKDLLDVFWKSHNPCAAMGTQYKSAIWFHDDDQKKLVEETMAAAQKERKQKIVTDIAPLADTKFHRAEDYHQKYYLRNTRDINALYRKIYPKEEDFVNSPAVAKVNGFIHGYGKEQDFTAIKNDLGLLDSAKKQLAKTMKGK